MQPPTNQVLGAAPAFAISLLNWWRTIFILNRFRGLTRLSKAEMVALLLYVFSGYVAWIGEMTILDDSLVALQIVASLFRASLNWFAMLLIVNERLYVTRQQLVSFVFIAAIALLWEVQHMLVLY